MQKVVLNKHNVPDIINSHSEHSDDCLNLHSLKKDMVDGLQEVLDKYKDRVECKVILFVMDEHMGRMM